MLASKTRWKKPSIDLSNLLDWQKEAQVSSLVAKLCLSRGWTDPNGVRSMLQVEQQSFHDPFLLLGMTEAVERIEQAIEQGQNIRIYGDYDCDGVSSTTIMIHILSQLGASFDFYIPNRFTEGYGLNKQAMELAKENKIDLMITVDTGISAWEEIEYAKTLGMDVIVTDHHEPPPRLPECVAIINPKQPGCTYPYKYLAGAGVCFKLGQALLKKIPVEVLDIACIGTIADLVPLTGENRVIAYQGLKRLNQTRHLGLEVLIEKSGLRDETINEEHVGFALGPRINASGRLDKADYAVQLLIAQEREEAEELVDQINELNQQRQKLVEKLTKEAIQWVEERYPETKPRVLVVAAENWNIGVIGIVASKLVERYYLPTVVLTIDEETQSAKGSARSIEGFDMYQALRECEDLLPHFGGHPMAAGLSVAVGDLEELRSRLAQLGEVWLTEEDLQPVTAVDVVCDISDLTIEAIEEMAQLAPFGVGNPKPVICLKQLTMKELKLVGANKNHLKCQFQKEDQLLDGIGFFLGELADQISSAARLDVIGQADINVWNGNKKPQLMLKDLRVEHQQIFDWRGARQVEQKLQSLCAERTVALFQFRESTEIPKELAEQAALLPIYSHSAELNSLSPDSYDTFVFWDLPVSLAQFKRAAQIYGQGQRLYVLFVHDQDHFFSTLPTREHFKWYYAFLHQRRSFDLARHGLQLSKHKGWSLDTIEFMTEVFLELEFAKMENGTIILNEQPSKKDLESSTIYIQKQEEMRVEQELLYSSYSDLVQLIEQWIAEEKKEEALSYGRI